MKLKRSVVSLLAAAPVALGLSAPRLQEPTAEFLLGILRRDGVVAPFAAFTGRQWVARWPNDIQSLEIPISVDTVPRRWWGIDAPPRTMAIWWDGVRAGILTVTGIATTRLMCEPRVTLKTSYKTTAPVPPPFELPYPKDGLVVSGDTPVERIDSVEKGSAAWNQTLLLLRDDFNRQENRAARAFSSWQHPVKESQRRLLPIAIEALYRAPTRDPDWTAYYVEAVREYAPGRNDKDDCGLVTYGHGWVLVGPNNKSKLWISAKVTYCDRKGVGYMLPLGLIRARDRVYWIYQSSGFDEEYYGVTELTGSDIEGQVSYRAGGCARPFPG